MKVTMVKRGFAVTLGHAFSSVRADCELHVLVDEGEDWREVAKRAAADARIEVREELKAARLSNPAMAGIIMNATTTLVESAQAAERAARRRRVGPSDDHRPPPPPPAPRGDPPATVGAPPPPPPPLVSTADSTSPEPTADGSGWEGWDEALGMESDPSRGDE